MPKGVVMQLELIWDWKKPENIYFTFSLIFGLLFVFITPPYQVPDERAHFFRANQIAEGEFLDAEGEIMQSIGDFTAEIGRYDLIFKPQNKISKIGLINELFRPLEKDSTVLVSNIKTNNYSAFNYLPQSFGILIGKLLNLSPYRLFLISRLINLIIGIFLITAAIRICPVRKWSLFFIGLLPMTLYQFSSTSPDTFVISLNIFYIALIVNLTIRERIERKMIALALVLTISMALIKPGYVFMCFLILLVPIIRDNKKFDILIKGVVILVTLALFTVWFNFSLSNVTAVPPLVEGVDTLAQLRFVLNNPFEFVWIMAKDLLLDFSAIREMFIGTFGWLDTRLPVGLYWVYSFALIVVFLADNHYESKLTTGTRVVLLVTFTLVFLATYSVFYLIWTPVGATYISGYQGRYLLPIIALLYISSMNRHRWLNFRKVYLLVPIWVLGGIITLITVADRFYVTSTVLRLVGK